MSNLAISTAAARPPASQESEPVPGARPASGIPSLAPWLGVLLCLIIGLNALGGWVRLSGSGVAIPQWPLIELDGGRHSLLPPMDAAGWAAVRARYDADQRRLSERVLRGELLAANLGCAPRTDGEFRMMFLTEWSHRLLAALVGLVAAGCLTTALRQRGIRARIGWPLGATGALIIVQAVLGGALVQEGTSTRWLFLHQANAGLIVGLVAWSLLTLLVPVRTGHPQASHPARLLPVVTTALVLTWVMLILGALVAGSRHGEPFAADFPRMFGQWLPPLWDGSRDVGANLLGNSVLHQFLHRWTAIALSGTLAIAAWMAWRQGDALPERLRLAVWSSLTFVGIEMLIGIANTVTGGRAGDIEAVPALAHQVAAMFLLISLVLAVFEARRAASAPSPAVEAAP